MKASRQRQVEVDAVIKEPTAPSEFEVQAFLWNGLRQAGVNARGEVKTAFARRAYVRFDIAVFEKSGIVGVLEVKAARVAHKTSWQDTRQGRRYLQYGVPVRLVYGMEDAQKAVEDARNGRLWRADKCFGATA